MPSRRARSRRPTTRKPTRPAPRRDRPRRDMAEPPKMAEDRPPAAYHALFPPDRPPRWTGTQRPPISYFVALFDDPGLWRETFAYFGGVRGVPAPAQAEEEG